MCKIDPISKEEELLWPSSVIVPLPSSFDDERGSIQPLVDMDMKSSVLISSNTGSVRANHYHKTDWHYCYVLYGEIIYYHRPHGSKEKPEQVVVKENQTSLHLQWLNMQWFSPNKLNLLLGEGTLGFKRFMKLMYFEYHQ